MKKPVTMTPKEYARLVKKVDTVAGDLMIQMTQLQDSLDVLMEIKQELQNLFNERTVS